jgi:hypothetical protein
MKITDHMPPEVKTAVQTLLDFLEAPHETAFHYTDDDERAFYEARFFCCFEQDDEWVLGENSEGGADSTIFRNDSWFYRRTFDGTDRPVPGGLEEVIENWKCAITG